MKQQTGYLSRNSLDTVSDLGSTPSISTQTVKFELLILRHYLTPKTTFLSGFWFRVGVS